MTQELEIGLQKYIRQGDFNKAIYYAIELHNQHHRSLMILLMIILCEEIGIANIPLIKHIINRGHDEEEEEKNCDNHLVKIIALMCESPKTRLCNHIKCYYHTALDMSKTPSMTFIESMHPEFYVRSDSDFTKECIDGIVFNLNKGSDNTFYWVYQLLYSNERPRRFHRLQNPAYVIFDIIKKLGIVDNELVDILMTWYKEYSNNPLFVTLLVLIHLRYDRIEDQVLPSFIPIDPCVIHNLYKRNKMNQHDNIIKQEKEYMDMMHKMGATECMKIENEDPNPWSNELYRATYVYYEKKNHHQKFMTFMNIRNINDLVIMKGNGVTMDRGDNVIVKESKNPIDACILDELKPLFGLKESMCYQWQCNTSIEKINKKNPNWSNNIKFVTKPTNYIIMMKHKEKEKEIPCINKKLLMSPQYRSQYLRILLFRYLFQVMNKKTIIHGNDGCLISIDTKKRKRKRKRKRKGNQFNGYSNHEIKEMIHDLFIIDKDHKLKEIKRVFTKYNKEWNESMYNELIHDEISRY